VKSFPAMLTEGDRAVYFYAAKHFSFSGTIVDSGCFVGGTTTCLAHGLEKNPLLPEHREDARGLIRVYDQFLIDDDYILRHLQEKFPEDGKFVTGGSFLRVFEDNMREFEEFIDLRPGDVTTVGYPDAMPIEILGVDICKALPVTDYLVRIFFPRLMAGALVIQQDFIHEFHPHIHLSMCLLDDHFEKYVEIDWGGSVVYKCTRPITYETIEARFGKDSSWYGDVAGNAKRLRDLAEAMLFESNRWVILLTLAVYYVANGYRSEAQSVFREARQRFPHFSPSENTKQLLGV